MEFRAEFRAYFPVAWICIPKDPLLLLLIFYIRNFCGTIFFFAWNLSDISLTLKFRNAPMFEVDLKRCLTWCMGVCRPVVYIPARFHVPGFVTLLVTAISLKAKGRHYVFVILRSLIRNTFKKSGSFRRFIIIHHFRSLGAPVVCTSHVLVPGVLILLCVGN